MCRYFLVFVLYDRPFCETAWRVSVFMASTPLTPLSNIRYSSRGQRVLQLLVLFKQTGLILPLLSRISLRSLITRGLYASDPADSHHWLPLHHRFLCRITITLSSRRMFYLLLIKSKKGRTVPKVDDTLRVYFSLIHETETHTGTNPSERREWTTGVVKNSFLDIKHVNLKLRVNIWYQRLQRNPRDQFSQQLR